RPRPAASAPCLTGARASSRACGCSTPGIGPALSSTSSSSCCNTSTASARTARTNSRRAKMNRYFATLMALLLASSILPVQAAIKVLDTTPEWASLTRERGGDKVDVYAATSAFQDVHRVEAKPSLVARARNADLVVAAG